MPDLQQVAGPRIGFREIRQRKRPAAAAHPGTGIEIDQGEGPAPAAPAVRAAADIAAAGVDQVVGNAGRLSRIEGLRRDIGTPAAAFDQAGRYSRPAEFPGQCNSGDTGADDADLRIDDQRVREAAPVDDHGGLHEPKTVDDPGRNGLSRP